MIREKKCKICRCIYQFDDGANKEAGISTPSDSKCPRCYDPHCIPGEYFYKRTVFNIFRKWLLKVGTNLEGYSEEDILLMMSEFPILESLYNSTTYQTVSIHCGTEFEGKFGRFRVENPVYVNGTTRASRNIICTRCNNKAEILRSLVLIYFVGLEKKRCIHCDPHPRKKERIKKPRNTSGLKRGGSLPNPHSERTLARKLNISRNDLRRHPDDIEPIRSLDNGTKLNNGFVIVQSFYCTNTQAPRYLLECPLCKMRLNVLQKNVECYTHPQPQCDFYRSKLCNS